MNNFYFVFLLTICFSFCILNIIFLSVIYFLNKNFPLLVFSNLDEIKNYFYFSIISAIFSILSFGKILNISHNLFEILHLILYIFLFLSEIVFIKLSLLINSKLNQIKYFSLVEKIIYGSNAIIFLGCLISIINYNFISFVRYLAIINIIVLDVCLLYNVGILLESLTSKLENKEGLFLKDFYLIINNFIFLILPNYDFTNYFFKSNLEINNFILFLYLFIFNSFIIALLFTEEFGLTIKSLIDSEISIEEIEKLLKKDYENLLLNIADIIEKNDVYTAGHSKRVMEISIEIGKLLKLSNQSLEKIRISGLLHDIGKIGVNSLVINKNGKLSEEEFNQIKLHPVLGFKIVSNFRPFYEIALYVKEHHEKLNGKGYPDAIDRKDISMLSRIISVADIYDALRSNRPYRKSLSKSETLSIMSKMADNNEIDLHIFNILLKLTNFSHFVY